MRSKEQTDKDMRRAQKGENLKPWSKLRVRMTISYVVVYVVSAW